MSGPGAPSAAAGIWPRGGGSTTTGPIPNIGYSPTTLPVVNNARLPPYNPNYSAPPIPNLPTTPFPQLPQLNTTNTSFSNNYPTQNPLAANNVCVFIRFLFPYDKTKNKHDYLFIFIRQLLQQLKQQQMPIKRLKMKFINDD